MRTTLSCLLVTVALQAHALPLPSESLPQLLPAEDEIRVALEAAPAHLRGDAGVYVLQDTGYRHVRDSRNGFNCLIERDVAASFEPRCFDAEGSETLLPVILLRAQLRARGVVRASIDREVDARYRRGEFIEPRRAGVCYMLSARNLVVVDGDPDKVRHVGPQLEFYAPRLRSGDLGATPDLESRLLVTREGRASAAIVVPVVSAPRIRVNYYSPEALTPLTRTPATTVANADSVPRSGLEPTTAESMAICGRAYSSFCPLDDPGD